MKEFPYSKMDTLESLSRIPMLLTAVFCGLTSAIAVGSAAYVFQTLERIPTVLHPNAGTSESIESYLFVFPGFAVAIFLTTAFYAVCWRSVKRRALGVEGYVKDKHSFVSRLDLAFVTKSVCVLFCFFEAVLLAASIYRCLTIASS